jgi:DNA-binding MarR family transcriptional regulator
MAASPDPDALRSRCWAAAESCTAFNLKRASRTIGRIYDAMLAPLGIRSTQFNLMVAVSLMGQAPLIKLADELGLDRTTLTRNLVPLEQKGWIESVAGGDRRVRLLQLTDSGRKVLAQGIPMWEKVQADVVEALGKKQWKDLIAGLKLTAALSPNLRA